MTEVYINPKEFRIKIMQKVEALKAQYYETKNRYNQLKREHGELSLRVEAAFVEYNMAKQRWEALMDYLDVIDEFERR